MDTDHTMFLLTLGLDKFEKNLIMRLRILRYLFLGIAKDGWTKGRLHLQPNYRLLGLATQVMIHLSHKLGSISTAGPKCVLI